MLTCCWGSASCESSGFIGGISSILGVEFDFSGLGREGIGSLLSVPQRMVWSRPCRWLMKVKQAAGEWNFLHAPRVKGRRLALSGAIRDRPTANRTPMTTHYAELCRVWSRLYHFNHLAAIVG